MPGHQTQSDVAQGCFFPHTCAKSCKSLAPDSQCLQKSTISLDFTSAAQRLPEKHSQAAEFPFSLQRLDQKPTKWKFTEVSHLQPDVGSHAAQTLTREKKNPVIGIHTHTGPQHKCQTGKVDPQGLRWQSGCALCCARPLWLARTLLWSSRFACTRHSQNTPLLF